MKLPKSPFFHALIPLTAQTINAFITFILFLPDNYRLLWINENLMFYLFISIFVITAVIVAIGYHNFAWWFLGGILIWIAAARAGANHVHVPTSATWNIRFGAEIFLLIAFMMSIMQLIIWCIIMIIKVIYRAIKKRRGMG